jgi:hypothetical protein
MRTRSLWLPHSLPLLAALLAAGFMQQSAVAGSFTIGDLAVLRAEASANNTTASIVELEPNTAGQSPSNIIAIPGTGSNAIRFSGSATSTGYLSHTNDRSLLTFTGANSTNTSSNVNSLNPRGVGTLDSSGGYAIQTTYTGTSGNQTRSASKFDSSNWFIGDQGGIYSDGTSSASPSGNMRGVKAFGGAMYVFTASTGASPASTINTPTGGSFTPLPGLPNNADSNGQDFYLVQSGVNGSTYDILYTLSASSNTAGIISKFSLVSGSWTANGTYTTAFGGFGIAAQDDGNGADLFVTTGQGAQTANSALKLFDAGDFNQPIYITRAGGETVTGDY